MKKKTWIVSEYYYPVVSSTGYYMTEIAEYLANQGLDVNVISTTNKYNEKENVTFQQQEIKNLVKIYRVRTIGLNKNSFISRGIRLIFSSLKLFVKLICNVKKNDEVLVVTNPAFLILLLPVVKFFKKCRVTILVHDIFPENLSAIKGLKKNTFGYKILKKIFDKAYNSVDKLISIGRDMTEVLVSKKIDRNKIALIPNWSDNDIVKPVYKCDTHTYHKINVKDKFIFQFAGNLGHAQGLENLLSAISMIESDYIHFVFIGGGAKEELIKYHINNSTRVNISYLGYVDREFQADFLNACDVSIVTLADGMFGLGVPSKSYNIMASGKPIVIIAEEKSEIAMCVREFNLGWVVPPNQPVLLAKTLTDIATNKLEVKTKGENCIKIANSLFAKKYILNQYYQLFK